MSSFQVKRFRKGSIIDRENWITSVLDEYLCPPARTTLVVLETSELPCGAGHLRRHGEVKKGDVRVAPEMKFY
jgi:hypothetical protein